MTEKLQHGVTGDEPISTTRIEPSHEISIPLKRLRLLRRMKQSHLAELLGVTQTTVSRWENGVTPIPEAMALAARNILAAPPTASQDNVLRRLVNSSSLKLHLICDRTHRLLAASPARQAEWRIDASDLLGKSMLIFASREILAAENTLGDRGWYDGYLSSMTVETRSNSSEIVPIRPGCVLWERVMLEDGSAGRLVTTVSEPPA